jgi:hypothetical protein
MYVDKVDELIDKILNMFYSDVWQSNKIKIRDTKFSDQGDLINKLVLDFINKIKENEMNIVGKNNVEFLKDTLKRYLCYYVYLSIYPIVNNEESFIKEIVEITKNIQQNKIQIKNFYNSANNSSLFKLCSLLDGIIVITGIDDIDKVYKLVKSNPNKYDPIIDFLNDVGNDLVQKLFIKKNPNYLHNIIKTIIFKQIYINQEKKDFLLFIESTEGEKIEYKYITIVVPKTDYIDFASIENILIQDFNSEIVEDVYNMMMEYDEYITTPIKANYKINQLFSKNIIVPIVEDFLRYHKTIDSGSDNVQMVDKIDSKERTSRQDNTKLKYIVTKMNDIIDYHSTKDDKKKKEIEKYFYGPLKDRRAILINELEEEKIIEKLLLQGSNVLANNPDFDDLYEIRQYAYINFRDLSKDGFTFKPEKTIEAVRDVNIQNLNQKGLRFLQLRIGNKNIPLNVVGIAIPNNISKSCMTLDMMKSISTINSNGYDGTYNLIRKNFEDKNNIYGRNKKDVYYWMFDINKDKIQNETFKNISNMNSDEYCKALLEKLYDDIMIMEIEKIEQYVSQRKDITLQYLKKIINAYNDNLLILTPKMIYDLMVSLMNYIIVGDYSYDKNENIIPGITSKLINLPVIIEQKEEKSIVRVKKGEEEKMEEIPLYETAVCMHNYEWDLMSMIRYKNPNKFNQLFFDFFKKYSMISKEKQFICKSCSAELDIAKYVTEYQGGNVEEMTISLAAERELENLPEYEKFTKSIKNIDKIISRIAGITKLHYYEGTEPIVKLRRQNIVKQVIDIIMVMSPILKEKNKNRARGEHSGKIYGIMKELSYVFGFDLDNEIFVYSSQEVDKFKLMKYDNILVYIVFAIIYELNNIDVLTMVDEKICNFILFEKFGINLFEKIIIRNNNSDGLTYITDYKLLCYVIFYISCMMSRYGMWFNISKEKSEEKKGQIDPLVQKMIIHTLVDMMNIILEINTQKSKNYLIEVVSTKFLIKLRTLFNDNKLYEKLKLIATKKLTIDADTKKVKVVEKEIPLIKSFGYSYYTTDKLRPRKANQPMIKEIKRTYSILTPINNLTILTNCETGKFHQWDTKFTCKLCKKTLDELMKEKEKTMKDNFMKNQIILLANKFCPDGKTHRFDPNTNKCILCNKPYSTDIGNTYSEGELTSMLKALSIRRDKNNKNIYNAVKQKTDVYDKTEKILIKLKDKYEKQYNNMSNVEKVIRQFIDILSGIMGETTTINNKNINLYHNTYIFMHDQYGNELKDPIILLEKDIIFKKEDNRNTIQYKVKNKNISVIYDAINLNLIGYKEGEKELVRYPIDKNDRFVIIHLSLLNKLRLFGFNSYYINVENIIEKYKYIKDSKEINKKVLIELLRTRLLNVKTIFNEIHRLLYQIINRFKGIDTNSVYKKYIKVFKSMKTVDSEGNIIFKDWKYINDTIFINSKVKETIEIIKDINGKEKYVNINDLIKIENTDKEYIYYFLTELIKLLIFNDDKYTKTNIGYMFADMIENIYETYFTNNYHNDLQKFNYILLASGSYTDETTFMEYNMDENFNIISEEDAEKQKELADIGNEEAEALDVDVDSEDVNEDFNDTEVQYDGPDVGENNEDYQLLGY